MPLLVRVSLLGRVWMSLLTCALTVTILAPVPVSAAPHPVANKKTHLETDKSSQAKSTLSSSGLPPGYSPQAVLNNAKRLRAKGRINEAIAELGKGLKVRRDPALLWAQANYLYEMERIPEAIKNLEESLEKPAHPDQYKKLAECYLGINRIDKAQDALTRGLKAYPKSYVLFMERATVAFANKQYESALKDLAQAEQFGKLGVDERRSRAKSLQKLGRYAEAAEQFKKLRSEKLHNGEVDTMGLLECWLQLKTHPDDVIAVATESIEKSTSLMQGQFLRMRARAYRQKGKPRAALADESNADKLDFDLEPGMVR